ncbi:hypothetical protein SAMN07250955_105273 [Arboricoccus pini]|uniref:Uncharacterized protein n=1 Tax=Arboricoccus pini TaxID=1963835 RepID=A0A212R575_9PROT|nr:hypothetical protein SAMN07250955_105273 [Arboricoccus pini]
MSDYDRCVRRNGIGRTVRRIYYSVRHVSILGSTVEAG